MEGSLDMFLDELSDEFDVVADVSRAERERAYLKSDRAFLGVPVPVLRRIVARLSRRHEMGDHDLLVDLVAACWSGPTFEWRRAAVELLTLHADLLGPEDLVWLEPMLRESETWALLDELAARVVGPVVERCPQETGPTLDRWAEDPDSFWLRRAALLALLVPLRSGGGDWERFTRYADRLLVDPEFFIRKAIGWILRDTSRRRPELVRDWVVPRLDTMSGVTRREALKYL